MSLMQRRRALMTGKHLPPVPSGYITDGLVFFLDGKQLVTTTKWTDIVGGKVFELTDCSVGANGIVFNGSSSRGTYVGYITNDWQNETIEVVFNGIDSIRTRTMFSQPMVDSTNAGIGLRFGDDGKVRLATGLVNVSHQWFSNNLNTAINRLSIAASYDVSGGAACRNGSQITAHTSSSYGKNESGITCLGCRKTTGDNFYNYYKGTIHAIRIYNRKLSVSEMQSNQAVDLAYYELS